jgi:hypothetical protein
MKIDFDVPLEFQHKGINAYQIRHMLTLLSTTIHWNGNKLSLMVADLITNDIQGIDFKLVDLFSWSMQYFPPPYT